MPQFRDVSGLRFGRLTVISFVERDKFKIAVWKCVCDCGKVCNIRLCSLVTGATKSCGCLNDEVRHNRMMGNTYAKTHSLSSHYLYNAWATMKQRCYNPKNAKFYLYGARGITVCDEWRNSFESFLKDMGERPLGYTLNRSDNDGNYTKDNCEWQTYSEQNRNRRRYTRKKKDSTGLFQEINI